MQATTREIVIAFHKVLGAVRGVDKAEEADTGKYKYRYQTLDDVLDEIHRVCRLNGLEITQLPSASETMLTMTNILIDGEGELLTFPPMCLPMPREAQALGSATTYLKRYSLVAQFGIIVPGEDDDGREATVAAQTQPGRRTEAERMIREEIGGLSDTQRKAFVADFKAQFSSSLADLPAARHGAALTWTKEWMDAWAVKEQLDAEKMAVLREAVAKAEAVHAAQHAPMPPDVSVADEYIPPSEP